MSQTIKREMNNLQVLHGTSHNQRWCHCPSASACASRAGGGGKRREGVLQQISLPGLQLGPISHWMFELRFPSEHPDLEKSRNQSSVGKT